MHQDNHHLAIIFDLGGVLLDWDPRYLYRKFFPGQPQEMERFLEEIRFNQWNAKQDAGRPFKVAVQQLCAKYPHYCDLIRAYDTHWEASITGQIQPTVEILKSLKNQGYPLYILSNFSVEKFQLIRDQYEFLDWFDDIFISASFKINKPDERIYRLVLDEVHRPASKCLVIDDSIANVQSAATLGFQTIHYQSPQQLVSELQNLGVLLK